MNDFEKYTETKKEIDTDKVFHAIQNDGVICYPTEGVWGLGCHPKSRLAFDKLLGIKQRSLDKGVILLAGELAQLHDYIECNAEIIALFEQFKSEFVTFVLPKSPHCPDYLTGGRDSIAVRVTHYAPLRELCLQAQTALVSTSANISGEASVATLSQAQKLFGSRVNYVDKPLGGQAKPSRIIAWEDGELRVLRD